jgi:hypothetical protein
MTVSPDERDGEAHEAHLHDNATECDGHRRRALTKELAEHHRARGNVRDIARRLGQKLARTRTQF